MITAETLGVMIFATSGVDHLAQSWHLGFKSLRFYSSVYHDCFLLEYVFLNVSSLLAPSSTTTFKHYQLLPQSRFYPSTTPPGHLAHHCDPNVLLEKWTVDLWELEQFDDLRTSLIWLIFGWKDVRAVDAGGDHMQTTQDLCCSSIYSPPNLQLFVGKDGLDTIITPTPMKTRYNLITLKCKKQASTSSTTYYHMFSFLSFAKIKEVREVLLKNEEFSVARLPQAMKVGHVNWVAYSQESSALSTSPRYQQIIIGKQPAHSDTATWTWLRLHWCMGAQ